ncbi:MAG: potassium channel family protein [Devosiaceae bacterium]|nr:potassium channel family protein [Devosiaceae bacterium]
MLIAILITFILVLISILIHYELLRTITNILPHISIKPRARLLVIITGVFIAHILEIALFALAFGLMQHQWGLGAISGALEGGWIDYFYFSASSYTTLGMGDIYPAGHLRFVAAIESLTGLVLIGWSASYTYLAMSKFWGMKNSKK